jgi:hypothetical protein
MAPHTMPSMSQPPLCGRVQTPNWLVPLFVQTPLQQSPFWAQMSLICPQYEGCAQKPFKQNCEQQSPPPLHGLPSVLQPPVGSGVHMPLLPHVWLQHCAFEVHAALSAVH